MQQEGYVGLSYLVERYLKEEGQQSIEDTTEAAVILLNLYLHAYGRHEISKEYAGTILEGVIRTAYMIGFATIEETIPSLSHEERMALLHPNEVPGLEEFWRLIQKAKKNCREQRDILQSISPTDMGN